LDSYNKKLEDELNNKIVKKAETIKNQKFKEAVNKIIKSEINDVDEGCKETEDIKPTRQPIKTNTETLLPKKPNPRFTWC
jgi:hypothetical protein